MCLESARTFRRPHLTQINNLALKGPVDLGSKKENAVELLNNLRSSQFWPYFDSKPKIDEVIEEIDLFMV